MVYTSPSAQKFVDENTTLFWFRRDLRLKDNAGLYHALKENENILGVFIFDSVILDTLDDKEDRRIEFIHTSLLLLTREMEEYGSSLLIVHANPVDFFKNLKAKAVYTNHDYEPYGRARDQKVDELLKRKNIAFKTFKDQVIFEQSEVVKDNGEPYTIFTPYSRKWKARLNTVVLKSYPAKKYSHRFKRLRPLNFPTLEDIGFKKTNTQFPGRTIKTSVIKNYHRQRDFPAIQGTSRLSVHLRFGTVSIRELVRIAIEKNDTWLNELIWRDFYHMILWHFPHVERAFKPQYDKIKWRNDEKDFQAWCEGQTGYPIVDAGMRELNETGFMHNRVRMIVASFLTKHLLIDWRWGEAYFAEKLLDFDLAANNGGWQWAAGSGCDAAPYFRVFNPDLQTKKFDPKWKYIKKWVPESDTKNYPSPIIDHSFARERVLKAYKAALNPGE